MTDGTFTDVFLVSPHRAVNVPSGRCEKIGFADFTGVWFLKMYTRA
jgi:hypothetical protein